MSEVEASNTGSVIILHTQEMAKERNQKRKGSTVENYILDMKKSNSLKARFRSSALSAALGGAVSISICRFRNV